MRQKYLLMIGIFILILTGVAAQLEARKDTSKQASYEFEHKELIQTETDPDFPCYIANASRIICPAINNTKLDNLSSKLGRVDKLALSILGIPKRNIEGNAISWGYINPEEETIIDVDVDKGGTFKIGFDSNEYSITDFSDGAFNGTQESGSDVYMATSVTTGYYLSPSIDLGSESSVKNISYASVEPTGTDISIKVRTLNYTDRGLLEGLVYYAKFDGDNAEVSMGNETPTWTSITGASGGLDNPIYDNAVMGEGPLNGALESYAYFDGVNDKFTIEDGLFSNNDQAGFTGAVWVYYTGGAATTRTLYERTYNNFELSKGPGTYWRCRIRNSASTISAVNSQSVYPDQWHHVVCVFNNTADTLAIYIDGSLSGSVSVNGGWNSFFYFSDYTDMTVGSRPTNSYWFRGGIDELAFWNRTLSSEEIAQIAQGEVLNWSDYSTGYTTSPSDVSVDNGKYAQFKATLTRTGGEIVHLDNLILGYDAAGPSVPVDNPPTVSLVTSDSQVFLTQNVTLNYTATDDWNLANATLYGDWGGTWHANLTLDLTGEGTSITNDFFNFNVTDDGTYKWNVLVGDNSSKYAFAATNKTFSISTTCVDTSCYPYVCDTDTNACYTSCTSHDNVNASSYCASDGTAKNKLTDGSSCQNLEYSGLADNNICQGGYCYDDNIGTIGEYCTDISDGCVDNGVEYNQGDIRCQYGDGNDYYQCLGGESAFGSLQTCLNLGTPLDASATVTGHTYCKYLGVAQICSTSLGCTNGVQYDCGAYFFNNTAGVCGHQVSGVTDDIKKRALDVGCGATYDLETCPAPNTLSVDGTTCTPPAVNDPPVVTLITPEDSSKLRTTSVDFIYNVDDGDAQTNCTLYFNTTTIAWNANITVTDDISTSLNNNFSNIVLIDGEDVTWNVLCTDSIGNSSLSYSNFSFSINTTEITEYSFKIVRGSEDGDQLFTINQTGTANFTENVYIGGTLYTNNIETFSPVEIPELMVTEYFDIKSSGIDKVRITNPYNEYLQFTGNTSIGNMQFALFQKNPILTTTTGTRLEFGKGIYIEGIINTTDKIYLNNTDISIWLYNQTYSGSIYNASYEGAYNSSYEGSYNASYEDWNYNQTNTDGIYNETYLQNNSDVYFTKIGIGTATPTTSLDIIGNATISGNLTVHNETYFKSNFGLNVAPWSGRLMRVKSLGSGTIIASFASSTGASELFTIREDGSSHGFIEIRDATNKVESLIYSDGTTFFNGTNAKVGIGTGNPNAKLEVTTTGLIGINSTAVTATDNQVAMAVIGHSQNKTIYGALGVTFNNPIVNNAHYAVYGYTSEEEPYNYAGYFDGQVYVTKNISADGIIDRSNWCNLQNSSALELLEDITNVADTNIINKESLPDCAVTNITSVDDEGNVIVEKGRDIGAYISFLTQVSQEQYQDTENIKNELCKKDDSYNWCPSIQIG